MGTVSHNTPVLLVKTKIHLNTGLPAFWVLGTGPQYSHGLMHYHKDLCNAWSWIIRDSYFPPANANRVRGDGHPLPDWHANARQPC